MSNVTIHFNEVSTAIKEVGLTLSPEGGKLIYSVVGRVVNGVRFTDILDVWLFE